MRKRRVHAPGVCGFSLHSPFPLLWCMNIGCRHACGRPHLSSLSFSSFSRRPKKAMAPSMGTGQGTELQINYKFETYKLKVEMMQCRERYSRRKYLESKFETYKLKVETCN
jgi:hypothetical protein